jgi:hypothetical protein
MTQPMTSTTTPHTLVYVTLGDGDFSYSYDLARSLQQQQQQAAQPPPIRPIRLVATGLDSHDELLRKYKDAPFLLQQLRRLTHTGYNKEQQPQPQSQQEPHQPQSQSSANTSSSPSTPPPLSCAVEIRHGVNAIATARCPTNHDDHDDDKNDDDTSNNVIDLYHQVDVLIFLHPHVATEDAERHAHFLSHLLHAAKHVWLKELAASRSSSNNNNDNNNNDNSNTNTTSDNSHTHTSTSRFYLTLVKDQWERWRGAEATQRHGWQVLHRSTFVPPPLPSPSSSSATDTYRSYYQLRRHQTGKSFANRRPSDTSETFCLLPLSSSSSSINNDRLATTIPPHPFGWISTDSFSTTAPPPNNDDDDAEASWRAATHFPCPDCDKRFAQARSLQSHVRAKHGVSGLLATANATHTTDDNRKRARTEGTTPDDENSSDETSPFACSDCDCDRIFTSHTARRDHEMAKHGGLHTDVRPRRRDPPPAVAPSNSSFGGCTICGCAFASMAAEQTHAAAFVPNAVSEEFPCSFCGKMLRGERAWKQHENVCTRS